MNNWNRLLVFKAAITLIWLLKGRGTTCQHNLDVLSPYKVDMANISKQWKMSQPTRKPYNQYNELNEVKNNNNRDEGRIPCGFLPATTDYQL